MGSSVNWSQLKQKVSEFKYRSIETSQSVTEKEKNKLKKKRTDYLITVG